MASRPLELLWFCVVFVLESYAKGENMERVFHQSALFRGGHSIPWHRGYNVLRI